jgi:hypothetical protein
MHTLLKLTSFKCSNSYIKLYLDIVIVAEGKLHGCLKHKSLFVREK